MALTQAGRDVLKNGPKPKSERDSDFIRAMCDEITFAYEDSSSEDTRRALLRVAFNVGLERSAKDWTLYGKFLKGIQFDREDQSLKG